MPATLTGQLQIGDQWNAISILAQSQTHPLKAVCELAENAIDAGATQVEIIRRRAGGEIFLEVHDNGRGVVRNAAGLPNFEHIATHVCDSMKRGLLDRRGVHGEYGIGLLSFWSLGDRLEMTSASQEGDLHQLLLLRGQPDYKIGKVRDRFNLGGTSIVVGPLLESVRNSLTGEKLQRYLSAELRDRIRSTGVKVRVLDRISRKEVDVTPREYEGRRLALPGHIETPFGEIRVELYLVPNGGMPEVALCKDGTRVCASFGQLDPWQRSPWTDGKLQGVIDCPFILLAPGNRCGVVPDERFSALVDALAGIEAAVVDAVADEERIEAEAASTQILKQVQKAFLSALRGLPDSEYLFFDLPRLPRPKGESEESAATVSSFARNTTMVDGNVRLFPVQPGPLAEILVTPKYPRRKPGEAITLEAKGVDVSGVPVADVPKFEWQLLSGPGELRSVDGDKCEVFSSEAGATVVEITAKQGRSHTATAQVTVKFFTEEKSSVNMRGLPSYRLESDQQNPLRSRYDADINEVVINSSHSDYQTVKISSTKHRRYVGKLYAKEVVLLNFPHDSAAAVAERLIEVLVRTEDNL